MNKSTRWRQIYAAGAKCLVRIVEKDQGYMAKCLTCSWESEVGRITPTSQAGRDHALKREK